MRRSITDAFRVTPHLVLAVTFSGGAGAATITFRDGSPTPFLGGAYIGTEDTMLAINGIGDSDQNFGARANMEIGERVAGALSRFRHGLIRFDVTAMDGQFATIDSVSLRLHVTDNDVAQQFDGAFVASFRQHASRTPDSTDARASTWAEQAFMWSSTTCWNSVSLLSK